MSVVIAPDEMNLSEIVEADLQEVARFLWREAHEGKEPPADVRAASLARLRWLFKENPAQRSGIPWGWILRTDVGTVVGAMACIPQRFAFRGATFTALMSAKFFVNEAYRGTGLSIFMRYLSLGKQYPLFCTSAGQQSGALWDRLGGYAIENQEHEMIGVARPAAVVEEAVFRRTKRKWVARATGLMASTAPGWLRRARRVAADGELDRLNSADEVMNLNLPEPTEQLTAVRDRQFIHWRHFSNEAEDREVYAYRRRGNSGASLVVVHTTTRGYRAQMRALTVMDFWGPHEPSDYAVLCGLLMARYKGQFDVLVFRGQPSPGQAALRNVGFVRRELPAPVAWCIDRAKILPTRQWYLVPADSE